VKTNPTVGNITNVLDKSGDGTIAMPVVLVSSDGGGPINKSPTIGRLEQALAVAEDGTMALPVEVVKLSDDGTTFERVTEIGGGGGVSETISWSNVQNKPTTFPPSEHNHDGRYYTKSEVDEPGFLAARVDNQTIQVQGGELKARTLEGLTLSTAQMNALLAGGTENIPGQINDIYMTLAALSAGMYYLGKFESKADLTAVAAMNNGDLAVVLTDESRSDARSMYVYNDTLGVWDFIGAFEFADTFTGLSDTPAGYDDGKYLRSGINGLYFDNIRYGDITDKPERTKTQIEQAVDKTHEHSNIASLNRVAVDEQGHITVDGAPYVPFVPAKQRLYARRTGSEQAITEGGACIFNTKYDGDIPYNTATGVFTLEADKTYRVMVTASIKTTGFVILHLVDANTDVVTSDNNRAIWTDINTTATAWHEASAGPLLAYVTPTVTTEYKIRVASVNGEASLRNGFSALEIQEV